MRQIKYWQGHDDRYGNLPRCSIRRRSLVNLSRLQLQPPHVCVWLRAWVELCVSIYYIYTLIYSDMFFVCFLSSNVFRSFVKCCQSCSQTFSVRAEELPRQPLARCTRGHIRDGVLDLFYTRVCATRCWVCIKACCSSLCRPCLHQDASFRSISGRCQARRHF